MNTFIKAVVVLVVAVVISASLPKSSKDFSVVMIIGVCACLIIVICNFFEPIISTITQLSVLGNIDNSLFEILLKCSGVTILSEFVTLVCNDSGNSALGKGAQLLGSVVILWLSLPLFTTLMDIVSKVLASS